VLNLQWIVEFGALWVARGQTAGVDKISDCPDDPIHPLSPPLARCLGCTDVRHDLKRQVRPVRAPGTNLVVEVPLKAKQALY
jgi:hypothetical protein